MAKNNSVSRSFKRFPCQRHRFNAAQVSMDCQPVIIGPHLIVLEALNKDVMGQSHSSLSGYITNHSKRVRLLSSSFIYKLRHSSLVNLETVPRCRFSTSTTVNKHVLTWLGGGGGWRSKRFPVIVAQRGWYSASTAGTTCAQSHKLLNKHGVGVLSARWRGQRINCVRLQWHNLKSYSTSTGSV